jgi:hypothetical protein
MCTLIGCGPSLEVKFTGANNVAGVYQVEVTTDGSAATCEVTLPLACDRLRTCTPSEPKWILATSGCALSADQQSIDGFMFPQGDAPMSPATMSFVVRRDGREVASGSATPTYSTSTPNGPVCGPACHFTPALTVELM